MQPDAIQRVADDDGVSAVSVEQRLDTEMVSRAEELTAGVVPDGEHEVAKQVQHAILTPALICTQDQFGVRGNFCRILFPSGAKGVDEVAPRIQARVRDDPRRAVQGEWLRVRCRAVGRVQQRMRKRDVLQDLDLPAVRTSTVEKPGHAVQDGWVDGRPVQLQQREDATHRASERTAARTSVKRSRVRG